MCACYMTRTPLYEAHYPNKIVQVFTRASDRYATFTTLLNLNASFAMMPRALRNCHPTAPDALPILRLEPVNPPPDFEAQKPATSDVDACPTSCQVPRRLQDLSCSRRTGSLLELTIAFLIDLADVIFIIIYSCSSVHHVDHPLLQNV